VFYECYVWEMPTLQLHIILWILVEYANKPARFIKRISGEMRTSLETYQVNHARALILGVVRDPVIDLYNACLILGKMHHTDRLKLLANRGTTQLLFEMFKTRYPGPKDICETLYERVIAGTSLSVLSSLAHEIPEDHTGLDYHILRECKEALY
jgi:hypothetical protein